MHESREHDVLGTAVYKYPFLTMYVVLVPEWVHGIIHYGYSELFKHIPDWMGLHFRKLPISFVSPPAASPCFF